MVKRLNGRQNLLKYRLNSQNDENDNGYNMKCGNIWTRKKTMTKGTSSDLNHMKYG